MSGVIGVRHCDRYSVAQSLHPTLLIINILANNYFVGLRVGAVGEPGAAGVFKHPFAMSWIDDVEPDFSPPFGSGRLVADRGFLCAQRSLGNGGEPGFG